MWWWLLLGHVGLAMLALGSVLRRRREPAAMLAWVFSIAMIPFLGSLAYGILGENHIRRKASRRRRRMARRLHRHTGRVPVAGREGDDAGLGDLPPDLAPIEALGRRLGHMPVTAGNQVSIYEDANDTFAALEQAIVAAHQHVHLLYYIWQPDETGRHFRDLLIAKARQGVPCRVLLDAVGCWALRRTFLSPMMDAGVRVAFFLPFYPTRRRWSFHLRNHRKIAVIDGTTAFMGSQNIGDEYRGWRRKLSPWIDSHARFVGPAALFLQEVFVDDWAFATGEVLEPEGLYAAPQRAGPSLVQVLPTGPDQDVSALSQLVFAAVASASRSIRIATPYFVPDLAVRTALQHASLRGVRVELLLPTRSDAPLVLWAGRSFYGELLEAGVEIYEFDAGVLHSKIMTVDDRWCMLGSANMDVRSFRLNFEVSALIYDEGLSRQLAGSFAARSAQSRPITLRDFARRGLRRELMEGAARLFSPLL